MEKFCKELGESTKGHFRKGSKEQGPMKLSIPIGQEFLIGLKALHESPKPRQIKF